MYYIIKKKFFFIVATSIAALLLNSNAPAEPLPTPLTQDIRPADDSNVFYLFYSLTCSRCWDARDFAKELSRRYPHIEFRELELVKDRKNQEAYMRLVKKLDIRTPGVPVFVFGYSYHMGFKDSGRSKREIIMMIERELEMRDIPEWRRRETAHGVFSLPLIGTVNAKSLSLPALTLFVGLFDGVNPCALWVLMLLLSLLANAGSRNRMIAVGSVFIFFSAVLYFAFMSAWFNFFALLGLESAVTTVLGICVCVLGIINAKELFWFKKGVSITIHDRAKPNIFKKMREVVSGPSGFLLISGTAALAFLVNLAEFGCTAGFPAVYTRILTVQQVGLARKYLFMALYCVAYVAPLAAVLAAFVLTLGKFRLTEKHGKILKSVTGLVMLVLGLILVFKPGYLAFT